MSNISISTDTVKSATISFGDVSFQINEGSKNTSIELVDSNKAFLNYLIENVKLTSTQKLKIGNFLSGADDIGDKEVSSVTDLVNKIGFISEFKEPFFEMKIGSKWYPGMVNIHKAKTITGDIVCQIDIGGSVGSFNYLENAFIGSWNFQDRNGNPIKKSISNLLAEFNIRVASKEAIEHSKILTKMVREFKSKSGKIFDASGTGLVYMQYWGWSTFNVGHKESVIIEDSLEMNNDYYHMAENSWNLPFVRVFSLKHKAYVYVDIEELEQHIFHRDDKNKIILPENMMRALDSVFNTQQNKVFGDLFHGRHGGIVVLANGPSGVGKTLTAEVFAEYQERPLYVIEMSEIGTNLKEVEVNLQKIFARANRWNAVLLFDEADIFLSERVASDLERSAIVGIFLRLLDYYEGTFFLTTNRGEGIDNAFKSRVTLYLNYPELSSETRRTIWNNMINAAGLTVEDDDSWHQIIETKLNGRQIRNQVRLLKLMYKDKISTQNIVDGLAFAAT